MGSDDTLLHKNVLIKQRCENTNHLPFYDSNLQHHFISQDTSYNPPPLFPTPHQNPMSLTTLFNPQ